MASSSSATLVNTPRRMRFSVSSAKKRSTMFSHDAEVGVKCRWKRWCAFPPIATGSRPLWSDARDDHGRALRSRRTGDSGGLTEGNYAGEYGLSRHYCLGLIGVPLGALSKSLIEGGLFLAFREAGHATFQ
jgi:hypothetical protein